MEIILLGIIGLILFSGLLDRLVLAIILKFSKNEEEKDDKDFVEY